MVYRKASFSKYPQISFLMPKFIFQICCNCYRWWSAKRHQDCHVLERRPDRVLRREENKGGCEETFSVHRLSNCTQMPEGKRQGNQWRWGWSRDRREDRRWIWCKYDSSILSELLLSWSKLQHDEEFPHQIDIRRQIVEFQAKPNLMQYLFFL